MMTIPRIHVVIDLETLSTRPNAAILAIGAVAVDIIAGKVIDEFSTTIDYEEGRALGVFHESEETWAWWKKQGARAVQATFKREHSYTVGLKLFCSWYYKIKEKADGHKNVPVWGNGASFDNAILSHAFAVFGIKQPWFYTNDRCYRTLAALFPIAGKKKSGPKHLQHIVVEDARREGEHLIQIVKYIQENR